MWYLGYVLFDISSYPTFSSYRLPQQSLRPRRCSKLTPRANSGVATMLSPHHFSLASCLALLVVLLATILVTSANAEAMGCSDEQYGNPSLESCRIALGRMPTSMRELEFAPAVPKQPGTITCPFPIASGTLLYVHHFSRHCYDLPCRGSPACTGR